MKGMDKGELVWKLFHPPIGERSDFLLRLLSSAAINNVPAGIMRENVDESVWKCGDTDVIGRILLRFLIFDSFEA